MPRTDLAEFRRLAEDERQEKPWRRWGPYLSERQWGTVREDYSAEGHFWQYFPHDQARSRAYRWGEDGLLGVSDVQCRLCFALALWNGRDAILKERLFGLTPTEGNHGQDVKEEYFYLDCTPTHSYMKALYKYPQAEYPYLRLIEENQKRGRKEAEYELADSGVFEGDRYFDVTAEYAKASPEDLLINITIINRGPDSAPIYLLPTLWFRNRWSWGRLQDPARLKPRIERRGPTSCVAEQRELSPYRFEAEHVADCMAPDLLYTENETNIKRLFGSLNYFSYLKDAFHSYVIRGRTHAVNPGGIGTKVAALYGTELGPGEKFVTRLRLFAHDGKTKFAFGDEFDAIFKRRRREADEFYDAILPAGTSAEEKRVARQAYAGLLWSKQFYHYNVRDWLEGDPAQPAPPPQRWKGRNADWQHLRNRDVVCVPDKWEYPHYTSWDLAFQSLPLARVDPEMAKEQLLLLLREGYMHPGGKLPSHEQQFDHVEPPIHAWACWRVYQMTGDGREPDRAFLVRAFERLLINFTWWMNRRDSAHRHLLAGGFLGIDDLSLLDRARPLPRGGKIETADATAWVGFYCGTMLTIALELARTDPAFEDVALRFLDHFVGIADTMNGLAGGLWDEADGFYYSAAMLPDRPDPVQVRVRSYAGLVPLFAVETLEEETLSRLPDFRRRLRWLTENRQDLAGQISLLQRRPHDRGAALLLAIPTQEKLRRALRYVLDESEMLSPFGVRSLSRFHKDKPFSFWLQEKELKVPYSPGEAQSSLFGGNTNWRGPVWFPLNHLLVESLLRYHGFYGDSFRVECPTGSGQMLTLQEVAREIQARLASLFLPGPNGRRPAHGEDLRYAADPHYRDLVLFYQYFNGDTGKGLGASHQTGWTALVATMLEELAQARGNRKSPAQPALVGG